MFQIKLHLPFFVLLAMSLMAGDAVGQARAKTCVTDAGQTIRTDRPCAAFNGDELLRSASAGVSAADRRFIAARASSYRPICAKTIEDLSYTLSAAMDTRDVNRFSSIYHWVGVSNVRANSILNRFERMTRRQLVGVELTGGSSGGTEWSEDADGYLVPIEHKARPPSGLRVRQQKAGGNGIESTQFRFVRNFGCYWLSF